MADFRRARSLPVVQLGGDVECGKVLACENPVDAVLTISNHFVARAVIPRISLRKVWPFYGGMAELTPDCQNCAALCGVALPLTGLLAWLRKTPMPSVNWPADGLSYFHSSGILQAFETIFRSLQVIVPQG